MQQHSRPDIVQFNRSGVSSIVTSCASTHAVAVDANLGVPIHPIGQCRSLFDECDGALLIQRINLLALRQQARVVRDHHIPGGRHGLEHVCVVAVCQGPSFRPAVRKREKRIGLRRVGWVPHGSSLDQVTLETTDGDSLLCDVGVGDGGVSVLTTE
jgi:hypothetical protein